MKTMIYTEAALSSLPILPMTVGYLHRQEPRDRSEGLLWHQLLCVNEGHGYLVIDGERHALGAGDLIFLPANAPHVYGSDNGTLVTSWLSFVGEGVTGLYDYFGATVPALYRGRSGGAFLGALSRLYEKMDGMASPARLSQAAFGALNCFFEEATAAPLTPAEEMRAYLTRHFAEHLTLEDIFAGYGASHSKLSADFKRRFGVTVFDMLTDIRLRHAQLLLESDPTLRSAEVGAQCGFADGSYFCKMYRRAFGKSPRGKA